MHVIAIPLNDGMGHAQEFDTTVSFVIQAAVLEATSFD